ncbi:hypothetical protein [Ornithinimicrobium pekingense]|uniref:DUF1795 domain-containing protein n=1 Tax=Ornithinimicrobium pekingense TaxID=384677 RepID=A0ABQ2F8Z9_9MICO|nr:hypothetical protein [Ornithinimicrobium pekingense]GGK65563.1 hypothetical protein GCM10011509_12290 [Ornithinimicrobium pekingense]
MTLTPRRRRPVATTGATALLALTVLAGCAQEEPTNDEVSSSAPSVDDAVATSEDAATGTADDAAATSQAPEEAAVTSAAPDDEAASTAGPRSVTAADDSFEIEIPDRWEDALDLVEGEGILVAAKDTERVDDFFTNVVVTEEEYVSNLTSAVEETAAELAGEDGEYELLEPVEVDGNRAPGYTLVREVEGVAVHQTQRWISHDGTLYVVTFSAVESQAEDAAPVLEEILASWTWND